MSGPDWTKNLDADERVLWEGRPDTGISLTLTPGSYLRLLASIGSFIAAGLVWWFLPFRTWPGAGIPLIFVAEGGLLLWSAIFFEKNRRRRTRYTLTSKRAFIDYTPFFGKPKQTFWQIDANTVLDFEVGALSTIWFHLETSGGFHGPKRGFERIHEGSEVYRLMRDIQNADL